MTTANHAESQARAQFESIAAMVTAAECDFDRLEELREERAEFIRERMTDTDCNQACAEHEYTLEHAEDASELAELEAAAGEYDSQEAAEAAIQEDPLSVEVRSAWQTVGEELEASEFCILLCTGGPAVRILGELDEHNEPSRAWLEYQDWGTPWTQYFDADQSTLLDYARRFYFA